MIFILSNLSNSREPPYNFSNHDSGVPENSMCVRPWWNWLKVIFTDYTTERKMSFQYFFSVAEIKTLNIIKLMFSRWIFPFSEKLSC